ncbi:DUF3349 domain-containing protein [Kocuria tytonis]|uniref:DUF3349 domain-containing protein n=1 Tax=Kocuria tytonis TaxID=2054280 RepID=A0A495A678_9MICC|nr:DUF3349 domain-containing protein [Kocuria tytonis]RKQ35230.1 DUF3349 domain-containing protein [Kocuria tytonis]
MMTFDAALDHIRAAYPHGVPPEQHVALAELLARTVGPHRTERLLETLDIPAGDLLGPAAASAEQLGDVAADLARAGWPLVGASQDEPPRQPGYVARVMNWLRADYPNGVPTQDYLPVLAVLRPQLADEDMTAIADQLAKDAREQGVAPSEADAREAIHRATEDEPKPDEIERIRAMLAAHGWPFEGE